MCRMPDTIITLYEGYCFYQDVGKVSCAHFTDEERETRDVKSLIQGHKAGNG